MNLLDKASIILTPTAYDVSKVLCVKPSDGTGDFDFSRSTEATMVNAAGTIVTVGVNKPRINYENGCGNWLFEPQSTNIYLNSETLVTQDVTTLASVYTVSFYGTGSITFSGTHTGSLVGTSVSDRVSLTFTATAGTLTSTITGLVSNGQCENLSYATSYITTAGSQTTRNQDICNNGGGLASINSTEGTLYFEGAALSDDGTFRYVSLSDGTNQNTVAIRFSNISNQILVFARISGAFVVAFSTTSYTTINFNKIAYRYKSGDFALFVNGTKINSSTYSQTFTLNTLNTLSFDNSPSGQMRGKVKCVAVWKEALTDAVLTSLTTI